ncbi:MAG: hypothetical protein K9J37_12810 [Saprospiraceae bacterium]|nr:hypothetical protein [Saprospiraceae bacterium]MCF8250788.1 hypothetical protein [Saprospiraceae bacterium]MCF8281766.1 hypothetical protein [Bacteroidales bacterium]MCF8312589.1 hypothetical protein [Saprospiraceae bacterium]MCF8440918.1 hypothetical protein [Saprospiraceae bacterium]
MQKVQIQAEIDLKSMLSQLGTQELEEFLREIKGTLTRRRTKDVKSKEKTLLQRLNEECALPEAHWLKFRALSEKMQAGDLSPAERETWFQLVAEEERMRLHRINLLGELAQLRGVSLPQIAAQLGIQAPDHAD